MKRIGFAISAALDTTDLLDVVKAAERSGYDSFWLTEGGGRDSISQLAVLAHNTSTIRLGTGIITIYSRSPSLIAMSAASLDEISGGRFILGLGTGHKSGVERSHGVPFQKPASRMRDYISIIKGALKDKRVSYLGTAYSVEEFRLGVNTPISGVPIYVAALGKALSEVAGEVADGVLPLLASPNYIREMASFISSGAKRAGRDPASVDIACFIISSASDSLSEAEQEARRQIARYGAMPFYQRTLKEDGFAPEVERISKAWTAGDSAEAAKRVSERMLESLALVGKPKQWQERIKKFQEAGVTLPIVYATYFGADPKAALLQAVHDGATD